MHPQGLGLAAACLLRRVSGGIPSQLVGVGGASVPAMPRHLKACRAWWDSTGVGIKEHVPSSPHGWPKIPTPFTTVLGKEMEINLLQLCSGGDLVTVADSAATLAELVLVGKGE